MYRLAEHVRTMSSEEGAVLLDLRQGKMVRLNPSGEFVVSALVNGDSECEISHALADFYRLGEEVAATDVREFIESLAECRLLRECQEIASMNGPSRDPRPKPEAFAVHRLLILSRGRQELLITGKPPYASLPSVSIPMRTRTTEHLQSAARECCRIAIVCLFSQRSDSRESEGPIYHIMEAIDGDDPLPEDAHWTNISNVSSGMLSEPARSRDGSPSLGEP